VADVLLEEIGHSVDARLNVTDAPGDEGAIFAAVVQGKELSQGELQALKSKDDRASILLGGEDTTIEMNQQRWTLNSYVDWRNQNFNWAKPNNISYQNGYRSDGKDGIYRNWRKGSPFDPPNTDIVNPLDYFATSGSTQANFEAGKTYKFRVSADDNIVVSTTAVGKSDSNWITPLNQARQPEWQTFPYGIFKEYSWTPTQSGSYSVNFWHLENTGDANVDISWEAQSPTIKPSDLNGTVTRNGQTKPVSLKRVDGDGDSTDIKNRPTWVVIHGMNNSPQTDSITELSKAIGNYKKDKNADQVLVLDWNQAAYSDSKLWIPGLGQIPNPYFGASWIPKVAEWTKKKLVDEWKISPDNINFAGHSLGSYLAWETAKNIGGVNNLIALDPAATTNGGYQEGKVNFSDYSKWAWAFYGSAAGNFDRAYTAEESFKFKFPSLGNNEVEKHGAVVKAFAKMIQNNNAGNPGYISKQFNLNQINQSVSKPWSPGNGFEAEIDVNSKLHPSLLKHKNGSLAESIYWA
jgi:pimeloyl-ACP methyl ester carboxylesterase